MPLLRTPRQRHRPNLQRADEHLLRELQIYMFAGRTILEEIPIMRRLLNHSRMQSIPSRPSLLVLTVAVDDAREKRLGGVGRRSVRRAGEFVDGKGERNEAEGDVETTLVG